MLVPNPLAGREYKKDNSFWEKCILWGLVSNPVTPKHSLGGPTRHLANLLTTSPNCLFSSPLHVHYLNHASRVFPSKTSTRQITAINDTHLYRHLHVYNDPITRGTKHSISNDGGIIQIHTCTLLYSQSPACCALVWGSYILSPRSLQLRYCWPGNTITQKL